MAPSIANRPVRLNIVQTGRATSLLLGGTTFTRGRNSAAAYLARAIDLPTRDIDPRKLRATRRQAQPAPISPRTMGLLQSSLGAEATMDAAAMKAAEAMPNRASAAAKSDRERSA